MPQISTFYGIVISMYWNEHGEAHFHAEYGQHEAKVSIVTGEIFVGRLPTRQAQLVKTWTRKHRQELEENWNRARARLPLAKIDPLL